jgi:hypothetical protein
MPDSVKNEASFSSSLYKYTTVWVVFQFKNEEGAQEKSEKERTKENKVF